MLLHGDQAGCLRSPSRTSALLQGGVHAAESHVDHRTRGPIGKNDPGGRDLAFLEFVADILPSFRPDEAAV